ncbi:hypothetical protein FDA94_26595 [Herbidospora galbida]|uniref:Uncharacterized protein n=1 Tax=Herbidospora galbida TaxID=2575442 RepID=A0A4U3M8N9_9ACTN|nr:hypothetical protein [Herbidospora galbida]TKK85241.1 hypothetical protein FDA94_26595 [Herbidospora galbida]
MSRRVVRFDLRGSGGNEAAARARAFLADDTQSDLSLLLILDEASALRRHRQAYEALVSSNYTDGMLCVATGPIDGDPPLLELPGSLTQAAGVIWVPDPAGITWRTNPPGPAIRRDRRDADTGLRLLLDVLSQADVFRETLRRLQAPGLVVNPGLRLAGVGEGQNDFDQALAAAATRLLAPGAGKAPALTSRYEETRAQRAAVRLRRDGPLDNDVAAARTAVEEAAEAAGDLPRPMAMFTGTQEARAAMSRASERLLALRDRLERLFSAAHSSVGLEPEHLDAIEREGVTLPSVPDFDATETASTIRDYIRDGLDNRVALPVLTEGLNRWQRRLMPLGSRARIPDLRRACPDEVITRLRHAEPMPGSQWWLPLAGLTSTALAAVGPLGVVSGPVMALLWTLLVTFTLGRDQPLARRVGAVTGNAVAAVAGVVGAVAAADFLLADPLPDVVWAGLLVLSLVVALGAVLVSWRARAQRWVERCGLAQAGEAVEALLGVAGSVSGEWARAGSKIAAADAVSRMSVALDQVGVAVRERAFRPPAEESAAEPDPRVTHYLSDLVMEAMAPRLRVLVSGTTAVHGEQVRHKAAELFEVWEDHVSGRSPYDTPPFGRERQLTPERRLNEDLPELLAAAGADPRGEMRQFCSAGEIPLLDLGAEPMTVRFASQRDRAALADSLPTGVTWIPSTQFAGTLRLLPLRGGVARQSWAAEPEQEAAR